MQRVVYRGVLSDVTYGRSVWSVKIDKSKLEHAMVAVQARDACVEVEERVASLQLEISKLLSEWLVTLKRLLLVSATTVKIILDSRVELLGEEAESDRRLMPELVTTYDHNQRLARPLLEELEEPASLVEERLRLAITNATDRA